MQKKLNYTNKDLFITNYGWLIVIKILSFYKVKIWIIWNKRRIKGLQIEYEKNIQITQIEYKKNVQIIQMEIAWCEWQNLKLMTNGC